MKLGLRHAALLITTLAAVGLNASAVLWQPAATAQTAQRAALVVRFGDGRVVEQCISFAEAAINGYDLLRKSTLPVVAQQYSGMGAAICKIADEGCNYPAEECFCKSINQPIAEQRAWGFWLLQNGTWASSRTGAGTANVTDGVVQGWVWGSESQAPTNPAKTFDQICNPTPTPTLTPTPTPASTVTVLSADYIGGGQVLSASVATPLPTPLPTAVVQANVPAAVAPTALVVAVMAAPVPTSAPTAVPLFTAAAAATSTPTPAPTRTPEPTLASTTTFTFTTTYTPTPTFTPEPIPTSTNTSTATSTPAPTPTFTPESAPASTTIPLSTPTPTLPPPLPETPPGTNALGYALFGVIVLGLLGGIALTRLRR